MPHRKSDEAPPEAQQPAARMQDLPAIDKLLAEPAICDLAAPSAQVVNWARAAVAVLRQELSDGLQLPRAELRERAIAHVVALRERDHQAQAQHVINATGVLLHTNLGRAPLAESAIERLRDIAGYTNVELDLASGKRHRRGARAMQLLAELTGAEDALVVNNCAAATLLALQAVAGGREVIVSRGQLVEIGGGFRLPEVFRAAGVQLREVGTTNRTYLQDYEAAISEQTGAIIRVHRSNFTQQGFVTEPSVSELARLAHTADLPMIDDCGSGCVLDLSAYGVAEPTVQQSLAVGSTLCLFSGDKLFGGPQAGMIVGKRVWIERLARSPLLRALRPDKLTLAALEATTEVHLSGKACDTLPFYQMLAASAPQIRQRCEHVLSELRVADTNLSQYPFAIVDCLSQIGGGSLPGQELPSFAVSIRCDNADQLAHQLRRQEPAVVGRVAQQHVLLDLRTVSPGELSPLVQALNRVLAGY